MCVSARLQRWKSFADADLRSRRALAVVAVEAFYRGVLQQPIFAWIGATFSGRAVHAAVPALGLTATATAERVLFNQFVVSPLVYYPLFFAITGPVQGLSLSQTLERARGSFSNLFSRNLGFWLPVQTIQFALVPALYKVPFICLCGLVWNVILSGLAGSVTKWRSEPPAARAASVGHDVPMHIAAAQAHADHLAATDHHFAAESQHEELAVGVLTIGRCVPSGCHVHADAVPTATAVTATAVTAEEALLLTRASRH
jgi:hypothetical protein